MALEDRIRTSVDQAVQSLVSDLIATSQDEVTRQVAAAEQQFKDAEQRMQAELEQKLAQMRDDELRASNEIQAAMQANLERQAAEAQTQADLRLAQALADAETRAQAVADASVSASRSREREDETTSVSRLVESIRGLDGAASLSEVLDALAMAAARDASRAAVVVLKADRVVGWRLSGFGARDAQPKSVDFSFAESGVIGLAAGAGRVMTTADTGAEGPGFEDLPAGHLGVAVPVLVSGRVVAVAYADSGAEAGVPASWPETVEILARHAGKCLEALTVQKAQKPTRGTSAGSPGASGASGTSGSEPAGSAGTQSAMKMVDESIEAARRLARLLVSEIRLYHEPAVNEGRRAGNLLSRLGPEIAQARETYDARVSPDLRARTDLFQQELIRTLAGGDASLLGATG